MKKLKTEELSKLSDQDLVKRLNDLRSELSILRSKAARGTLKKELGEIKSVRKNVARALTAINAKKQVGTPTMTNDDKSKAVKAKEEE